MEWNETLQQIIDYVEQHLQRTQEAIDPDEIAKMAGCSYSFFQKVFSYMNQMSFADYVRARKLTLAGYDLKSTKRKVIDIAYQYGYDSPTSFTKAFQQFHGITPKEARQQGIQLHIVPKMQLQKRLQYTWRLEDKPVFTLIGKQKSCSKQTEDPMQWIPAFWNSLQKDGTYPLLYQQDQGDPKGMFGCFLTYEKDALETTYAIMVISDQPVPDGWTSLSIPSCTWAVFDCRGPIPKAVQDGWDFLTQEWLEQYPFQHAPIPELEWHSDGNPFAEDYLSQIWIPIIEEEKR